MMVIDVMLSYGFNSLLLVIFNSGIMVLGCS